MSNRSRDLGLIFAAFARCIVIAERLIDGEIGGDQKRTRVRFCQLLCLLIRVRHAFEQRCLGVKMLKLSIFNLCDLEQARSVSVEITYPSGRISFSSA